MKLQVEPFTSLTGWTFTGGASAQLNQHPDLCADGLASSLIFHFPALGASATKTITVDATGYSELVLSLWSRNLKWMEGKDAAYSIDFGSGHAFFLPTRGEFSDEAIGLNGWGSIIQVTVTALTAHDDYLCLSNLNAVRDEYPQDVFEGVRQGLLSAAATLAPSGIITGKVTCAAGDKSIMLTALDFVDRMAVLYVSDGASSETHQVERYDGGKLWFTSRFDGQAMKYNHSAAQVYVSIVVDYGVAEKEAAIPGITVWGFAPSPEQTDQDVCEVHDTFGLDGTVAKRRTLFLQEYPILIDCEARHYQVLALLSRIARWFESSSVVWINGRRHDVLYSEVPTVVDPDESVEMFPKVQYTLKIQVREERDARSFLAPLSSRTVGYHVQNGGVLPQEGP